MRNIWLAILLLCTTDLFAADAYFDITEQVQQYKKELKAARSQHMATINKGKQSFDDLLANSAIRKPGADTKPIKQIEITKVWVDYYQNQSQGVLETFKLEYDHRDKESFKEFLSNKTDTGWFVDSIKNDVNVDQGLVTLQITFIKPNNR